MAPARADHTLASAKRSFDRYHPRIVEALGTIRQIGAAAAKEDVAAAEALMADKLFSVKGRRAFSIYATSFSDNYLGEQSRALLKHVEKMFAELEAVAKGKEMAMHYDRAIDQLELYYEESRLPKAEVVGLRI